MPKQQQSQQPIQSIQWLRQHAAVVVAIAASLVVALSGVAYDRGRREALTRYMDQRSEGVVAWVERLTMAARAEAAILALQNRAGDPIKSSLRPATPAESALLERDPIDSNLLKVTRVVNVGPSGSLFGEGRTVALLGGVVSDGISATLMPPPNPTHLTFCANGRGPVVACAATNVQDLVRAAAATSVYGLEVRVIGLQERPLAQTPGYDDAATQWGVSRSAIPHTTIQVLAKPPPDLIASFQINAGLWLAGAGLAAIWLGYLTYARLRRSQEARRALVAEVEREKEGKLSMLRKSLHEIAGIGGLRFYLIRVDSMVELFGPWGDAAGIEDRVVTMEQMAKGTDRPDEMLASARAAFAKREPWSQVFGRNVDGEHRVQQSNATPILLDGEFLGMVGVAADITVAMEAQNMRNESRATQVALTTYLRHLADEVSGPILHAKSSLGLLRTASQRGDMDQSVRWLDVAESSLQRLSDVVRTSLDLMKLRQSTRIEQLEPRAPLELVEQISRNTASMLGERGQKIEIEDLSTGPALVHTESLLKMLKHVFVNAVLYSPSGSAIHVEIRDQGDRCEIVVEDEGPGMSDADLGRVGQPFFRGSAALSMKIRGNGLGAAMTMELARHSMSAVRFERSPLAGRGLRVTISLPRARESRARRHELSGGPREIS